MAYLGRVIENLSDRLVLDSLTASATASYTLQLNSVNFVPSSAESLTVSLNGVIQAPISSYTVSGSTLTFASALTSSDSIDFIIAERGITLQTPSAGSVGTSQLASTLDLSSKTITLASNMKNTPAFGATQNSTQTVSNTTWTELTNFGREIFDTDNNFASNRFTPTTAGKYFFYASTFFNNITAENYIALSKNGAITGTNDNFQMLRNRDGSVYNTQVSGFFDMNGSTDYVSVFVYQQSGSNQDYGSTNHSHARFTGYKLIGV